MSNLMNIAGLLVLSLPFLGLAYWIYLVNGYKAVCWVFGFTSLVTVTALGGVWLLHQGGLIQ